MSKPNYIFESPDGGKTIYRRSSGNPHRELHYESDEIVTLRDEVKETQLWHDIRQAARNDPALAEMLDKIKMYWFLQK
jgi:hypothetical protein